MPITIDAVSVELAHDFKTTLKGVGKSVLASFNRIAVASGVDPLLMAWFLFEMSSDWQQTIQGEEMEWLDLAVSLMRDEMEIPAFQNMQRPDLNDPNFDAKLDTLVRKLATWSSVNLLPDLLSRYRKALLRHISEAQEIYQIADPKKAGTALTLHLMDMTRHNRLRIYGHFILQQIFLRFEAAST